MKMRSICKYGYGGDLGFIETRNGQDCVFCERCNRHQYNAPKTETGRETRSVTKDRKDIKPNQRARVLMRATGRCELCGSEVDLHVGHLVSVDVGRQVGMTDRDINYDDNLAAMCSECNLGIGKHPVPLRLIAAIVRWRIIGKQVEPQE